jgi:hypothetical protein
MPTIWLSLISVGFLCGWVFNVTVPHHFALGVSFAVECLLSLRSVGLLFAGGLLSRCPSLRTWSPSRHWQIKKPMRAAMQFMTLCNARQTAFLEICGVLVCGWASFPLLTTSHLESLRALQIKKTQACCNAVYDTLRCSPDGFP